MDLVDPFADVLSFTARTNTRTTVPTNTRFIFEVTDLKCATPALVSLGLLNFHTYYP
jgi:hypothetical protein